VTPEQGAILWIAGAGWDDTPGTDRRLVTAIATRRPVLWVDPPRTDVWAGWLRAPGDGNEVAPGVVRMVVPAPPGFTRGPMRAVTAGLRAAALRAVGAGRLAPAAVVVSHPLARFPRGIAAPRILYATDDWVAGAGLMGLRASAVRRTLAANARSADALAAITTPLVTALRALGARGAATVVPNGAPRLEPTDAVRSRVAGLVGQLNERIDVAVLESLADAGVPLRLIGPRADRDPEFGVRLDTLIARDGVEWTGALGTAALRAQLADIAVGLTPYADSAFNRASFPLKTLEYLAAGVPVVSSALPASRWLASPHVRIAESTRDFVQQVQDAVSATDAPASVADRIAFAASHDWEARAEAFLGIIDAAQGFSATR